MVMMAVTGIVPARVAMTVGRWAPSSHLAGLIEQKDMMMVTLMMMIVLESPVMAAALVFSVMIVTAPAARLDITAGQKERSDRESSRKRCH